MQNGQLAEQETYDAETGELKEPTLSQQAMKGVRRPNLWQKRDNAHTGVIAGDEFSYAFLCVQEELRPIIEMDKTNPFAAKDDKGKSADPDKGKYTSLGALLKVVRPVLNKWFFTFEQYAGDVFGLTDSPGNKHLFLPVFTRLEHVPSMQHKIYKLPMPIVTFNCQAVGSALTYGKRYSLLGALGLSSGTDDDDGNRASVTKGLDSTLSDFAQTLADKMKAFKTPRDLKQWATDNASGFDILEESDRTELKKIYSDLLAELVHPEGSKAKK